MIRMQKLTDDFTKANPGIKINWVTLEENILRQKVTTDIATKGGQYDVVMIGVAMGPARRAPIRAALLGRLISGLITDESTAEHLLRR